MTTKNDVAVDDERSAKEMAELDARTRAAEQESYWEDDYRYPSYEDEYPSWCYEAPRLEPSVTFEDDPVLLEDWNTPDSRWNRDEDDLFYADMIRQFDEDWKEYIRAEQSYDPDAELVASLAPKHRRLVLDMPRAAMSSRKAVMYSEKKDRCIGWFGDDANCRRVTFYGCRFNGKNSKDRTLRTHRTGK